MAFDDKEIEAEKLRSLFEAAMWAPSSRNAQPWRFIYVKKSHRNYQKVFNLLDEGNKEWAFTAPVLAISIAETISTYKGRPNYYAFHDTGMAICNLLLQATHLGLFVHQMGGYNMEKAEEVFRIPERYTPVAMMAIGYKGDPSVLEVKVAEREQSVRRRNKITEHLYEGVWGELL